MYLVRPPYLLKKLYPKAVWRMSATQKIIYLTFDDGPVSEITPWVLDLLKEKNINATFFCVGENVQKNPEIFQRIKEEKHTTGNHTFNHVNGWNTHTADYLENVEKCAADNPTSLFRPPYGKLKKSQYHMLGAQYSIIMWDVLSGDYDKDTTPEKCLENVLKHVRNGSVIVFHDSYKAQKKLKYALPRFIDWALSREYEFAVL
ncbi:MAG: pdaA [Bacteroidetes bacterium]|nr:pdaA [Bacteroidota bacterium]